MSWWQQLYQYGRHVLEITQKVERHDTEIKDIQQDIKDLTAAIHRLAYEVKLDRETESKDREMLMLRVENQLLKFERRLLPPSSDDERNPPA